MGDVFELRGMRYSQKINFIVFAVFVFDLVAFLSEFEPLLPTPVFDCFRVLNAVIFDTTIIDWNVEIKWQSVYISAIFPSFLGFKW